jgi:exopolysaccharide biosynthesis predicted pyruvyltransferase EpsI
MRKEFTQLAQVMLDPSNRRPYYYMNNRGNWGDGLIRQGTLKFFHKIGFHYYELSLHRGKVFQFFEYYLPLVLRGTLIYGGGAGWTNFWPRSYKTMNNIATSYQKVIVLPSTYEKRADFPNITYYCRDRFESLDTIPEAVFCHDMAFFLEMQSAGKGNGEGYFYREDIESSGRISIPPENVDISAQGNHLTPTGPFFDTIDQYKVIYTDRLHVAIAGCLLKKEVHLYPGGYFKNKAVYRSSMQGIFENITFHEL